MTRKRKNKVSARLSIASHFTQAGNNQSVEVVEMARITSPEHTPTAFGPPFLDVSPERANCHTGQPACPMQQPTSQRPADQCNNANFVDVASRVAAARSGCMAHSEREVSGQPMAVGD